MYDVKFQTKFGCQLKKKNNFVSLNCMIHCMSLYGPGSSDGTTYKMLISSTSLALESIKICVHCMSLILSPRWLKLELQISDKRPAWTTHTKWSSESHSISDFIPVVLLRDHRREFIMPYTNQLLMQRVNYSWQNKYMSY
jgi:hypothetical protein